MLGAAALTVAVALTADAHRLELGLCGAAAVLLLLVSVAAERPALIPWSVVLLAAAYVAGIGSGRIDQWAPLVAGALLVIAELAYWSLELHGRAQEALRLAERRAGLIATLASGAVALGGLVLAATSIRLGTSIAADLLGVAAAVGALAIVATLARARR